MTLFFALGFGVVILVGPPEDPSAQFGDLEEEAAIELSDFKEEFDQYNNNYATSHKLTLEQALADSERDQVANRLGRERGHNNPTCDCRILMRDTLPENKR